MGVMKKAPRLGSSSSVGETGQSVIEGDRSLLSHYGDNLQREKGTLRVAARKLAALRRNLVARGLAREYGDQKTREKDLKTQIPRSQRQQKILENYQRHQTQNSERKVNDEERDDIFDENVGLKVPLRLKSAPFKSSNSATRRVPPIVPPKDVNSFQRHVSMRQPSENQNKSGQETSWKCSEDTVSSSPKLSPSEADIPRPVLRPSASRHCQIQKLIKAKGEVKGNASNTSRSRLSVTNKSSRIVLRELEITKDIMMREQLVRQLKQTLPVIDVLAKDFVKCQDEVKRAQITLETVKAISPSRAKRTGSLIGLILNSPTDEDENAVIEAETAVTESKTHRAELIKRLKHHLRHVGMLINGLQQATISIVDNIVAWRQMQQRRRHLSNFHRLFRFPWQRQKISNYLLYIESDLQVLFPSVALELLLGPKATCNPLLLSQNTLQTLGISSTGKTFLTESQVSGARKHPQTLPVNTERSKKCCLFSADLRRLREILVNIDPPSLETIPEPNFAPLDPDKLRQCLEVIYQENALEESEKVRCNEEIQRVANTYDPFSSIKSAGGVEETLTNMLTLQSPISHLLCEQLRLRQENTCRVSLLSVGTQDDEKVSAQVLHVNPQRLRLFLEKRAASLESGADCEVREVQKWGHKNKLHGKVVVRKNNEKRQENHLARKIQRQYFAHRQRTVVKTNLAELVRSVRFSAINIQRVYRGHRAKCDYKGMKSTWLLHKKQVKAARTIVNAFRRFRRRQRHRSSMTVESIAQAQLISILTNKTNESGDAQGVAERYRRVGEERRRQRIVLLQKHKMEQQEMERKRNTAAIQMQAVVRAHLAQGQAKLLRQEKKAHMTAVSAMAIQSTIRKFLNVQQHRRQRFRKDLERVNRSAVRIQSIYRGYNSRASLLCQLDEQTRETLSTVNNFHEGESDDEDEDSTDSEEEDETQDTGKFAVENTKLLENSSRERLPLIVTSKSRPSSGKLELQSRIPMNPVSFPPLWKRDGSSSSVVSMSSSETGRRISMGMSRIELKLKDAELGDNFVTPPSRRVSFLGSKRHLL